MYYAEENERLRKIVKRIAEGSPGTITPRPIDALLYSIIRATNPDRCLELGAYEGTTTLYLAQGLSDNDNGRLTSIEIDESNARGARKHLEEAGIGEYVDVKVGDSREIVPELSDKYDLIFINTDPNQYIDDYRNCRGVLGEEGIIAIDTPDTDENKELYKEIEKDMDVIKFTKYSSFLLAQ